MPIDDARREKLLETLEVIRELKIPEHLQEVALSYLLGAGVGAVAPAAPPVPISRPGGTPVGLDLRSYISNAAPKGAVAEIPALLFWARENEGRQAVNERDVVELYRRAGLRPPKAIGQSFRDLSSKKYLRLEVMEGRRGYFQLSRAGEDFVLHDLKPKAEKA